MGCIASKTLKKYNDSLDKSRWNGKPKEMDEFDSLVWKDTKPFVVPLKEGKVIKVYDGDTITIANRLPLKNCDDIFRFSVRLNGIDTPEMRGNNDDEKQAAKNAKEALSKLILNKHVILKNVGSEKYGRVLADVYLEDLNINKWMIEKRFALKYDGGTKQIPTSWLKYTEDGSM